MAKVKKEEKPPESAPPSPDNTKPEGLPQQVVVLDPPRFKAAILQQLVKPTAMPGIVVWWDDEGGWRTAVHNDIKIRPDVRNAVAQKIFKIIVEVNLFNEKQAD